MFLDVSGSVVGMEITDEHRAVLSHTFEWIRTHRFQNNRKAAYTAAGVNSATWSRLEAGLSVKERTLTQVLTKLLPESHGDWRQLNWTERDGELALATSPRDLGIQPEGGDTLSRLAEVERRLDVLELQLPAADKPAKISARDRRELEEHDREESRAATRRRQEKRRPPAEVVDDASVRNGET